MERKLQRAKINVFFIFFNGATLKRSLVQSEKNLKSVDFSLCSRPSTILPIVYLFCALFFFFYPTVANLSSCNKNTAIGLRFFETKVHLRQFLSSILFILYKKTFVKLWVLFHVFINNLLKYLIKRHL